MGGWLLTFGKEGPSLTQPLLLVRMVLLVGSMVLVAFSIKEEVAQDIKRSTYGGEQFRLFASVLRSSPFLVFYSASVLLQGMLLASLESYWQPYLKALLLDDSMLWILGGMTTASFSQSVSLDR